MIYEAPSGGSHHLDASAALRGDMPKLHALQAGVALARPTGDPKNVWCSTSNIIVRELRMGKAGW